MYELWYQLLFEIVMARSAGLSHYNSYMWIFPSWKIKIVLVGIKAILDPRSRPLGPNTSIEANLPVCCRTIGANTCFPLHLEF